MKLQFYNEFVLPLKYGKIEWQLFTDKLNYLTRNSNDKFTDLNGKNKNWNAKGVKMKHLINDGM